MPHQQKRPANPRLRVKARVAVLVDTSTEWSRRVIAGIGRYVQEHDVWQLFIEPRGAQERLELPRGWRGDGIIARISNEEMARHMRARRLPVVNVSAIQLPGPQLPRVSSDTAAIARMAVEYFLDRGFKHFAYLSFQGLDYVMQQKDAFIAAVQRAGCRCVVNSVKTRAGAEALDWNLRIETLGAWLASLPKPVAILTWSGGREVIHACHNAALLVPEEIAVLSGTDDFLCELSHVPISAVRASCERIGYEAAALLAGLMRGGAAPAKPILVAPVNVVTRQSTDVLAISDAALLKALRYIRSNAGRPTRVGDVAARAGIARRALERRFMEVLGRTPADYIRRAHLDRARTLLIDTGLPISEVADQAGFTSPDYMAFLFRKTTGMTPLRCRQEKQWR